MGDIQMRKYLVCEKSDGLRYFLIETKDHAFYIVDRKYDVRKVNPRFVDMRPVGAESIRILNIFDGELILDRHQPDIPIFLVFDAILTNG